MSDLESFVRALRKEVEGEVNTDLLHRGIYATDASIYQIMPECIIYPKHAQDLLQVVARAGEHHISLLPRGGATSLAGQAVGKSAVLDFTRYMHHIHAFDPNERWITVDPGITCEEVNLYVREHGLEFAPDPATASRATIGGMIANNSSGTKSILHGKTSDHVMGLKVLLSDGTVMHIGPLDVTRNSDDLHPLLRKLRSIVKTHDREIRERFPRTMRRVAGYCLDELLGEDPWQPHKIFLGSEGTLGIILEAKLRLVPIPAYKCVAVVHFDDGLEAVRAVQTMLRYNPVAVEILTDAVLNYSRKNLATREKCGFLQGKPAAIQIVEFYGESRDEVMARAEAMCEAVKAEGMSYAAAVYPEDQTYDDVWTIRKKGLGLLMGEPSDKRGIAFIEDAAVPVEVLPEYIEEVLAICAKYDVHPTYYAHASVGVIHVRPMLDLRRGGDIEKMKNIAREAFSRVVHYNGAWSGEHGDGLVRSGFLRPYFGEELYAAFRAVKMLFDPYNMMNPGKIIDPPPMDQNLRYGETYRDHTLNTRYHYRDQRDFHTAVHQCSGIGACRKMQGGTMCPSFMVTRDETHTTRGRANALRLAMSGQMSDSGLGDPALLEALDLCISCKACKAECPSSVDMARLKGEVLQIHYDAHGPGLRDRLIGASAEMAAKACGPQARLINALQRTPAFKWGLEKITGFDKRRTLPGYATQSFLRWFNARDVKMRYGQSVFLFTDTYMNYHQPEIGQAAVRLINTLGFDVVLVTGCCQRPHISHGFLDKAKNKGTALLHSIDQLSEGPLLVCEPGCTSALTDDLPDLADDSALGDRVKARVMPIERWVARQLNDSRAEAIGLINRDVVLHGHCHQKALFGTQHIHDILTRIGAQVYEPDSGCCGMAGSFGYEKEHYDISEKMARRVLTEAIAGHPEAQVLASGFSCRHQIAHFTGRKAIHWLNALNFERM